MALTARLRALVDAAPPSATVPVSWIAEVLEEESGSTDDSVTPDLTLEQVRELLNGDRAVSTIRTWCSSGLIPGAYRLRGREWRIPRRGLTAFLAAEQLGARGRRGESKPPATGRAGSVDLGSWRKLRRSANA